MSSPSDRPPRPTLRTVADRAGVSVAVVSYSFSRPDRVAEATRARVLAVAEELGYAGPNPAARALRTGKTDVIGFLFDHPEQEGLPTRVGTVASVLLEACARRNISLVLPTGNARPACDGAIVLRPYGGAIDEESTSIVTIGPGASVGDNVVSSSHEGIAAAAADLKHHGHSRVAFLADSGAMPLCERAAADYGPEASTVLVREESPTAGAEAMRHLLSDTQRPTAVFAVGVLIAYGVREAVAEAGLSIPDDLSLVALGDSGSAPHDISAVEVPIREIGEAAVRLLLEIIDGKPSGPGVAIPNQYRPGTTVGPALPS